MKFINIRELSTGTSLVTRPVAGKPLASSVFSAIQTTGNRRCFLPPFSIRWSYPPGSDAVYAPLHRTGLPGRIPLVRILLYHPHLASRHSTNNKRLVPVDNSLIFINFMNRLRAKRTDSLTNRFFLLSIRPV